MLPAQLRKEDFSRYPPEARDLAQRELALLRALPLSFVPLLLRELIVFDWKFPVERKELIDQIEYLRGLSSEQLQQTMAAFVKLRLPGELEAVDWVNSPSIFSEQLSASLWSSHQIDAFRAASVEYVRRLNAARPKQALAANRIGIVVI